MLERRSRKPRERKSKIMKLRIGIALMAALIMAVMVGGVAFAKGGGNNADTLNKVILTPTATGNGIGAIGEAKVRTRADRGIEKFEVTMFARRVNGQTFKVYITNSALPGQRFLAGKMLVQFGSGQLHLSNEFGATLPNGASPVTGIQTVVVKNSAGKTVLRSSF